MKLRLPRKLKYLRKARHWRGHGIHSPYLFYLVTKVIEDKKQYPAYSIFRSGKKRLYKKIKEIVDPSEVRFRGQSIQNLSGRKKLFKTVELGYRYGKLIFRLINEFNPAQVSICGPTFGLNLLYIALADQNRQVNISTADLPDKALFEDTLQNFSVTNVRLTHDEDPANKEFIFINLPLLPDETKKAVSSKLAFIGEDDVMIIRGIHKSAPMETIWKELIAFPGVKVTLDLYEIGIVLFRKKLQKEHFVLRF